MDNLALSLSLMRTHTTHKLLNPPPPSLSLSLPVPLPPPPLSLSPYLHELLNLWVWCEQRLKGLWIGHQILHHRALHHLTQELRVTHQLLWKQTTDVTHCERARIIIKKSSYLLHLCHLSLEVSAPSSAQSKRVHRWYLPRRRRRAPSTYTTPGPRTATPPTAGGRSSCRTTAAAIGRLGGGGGAWAWRWLFKNKKSD